MGACLPVSSFQALKLAMSNMQLYIELVIQSEWMPIIQRNEWPLLWIVEYL